MARSARERASGRDKAGDTVLGGDDRAARAIRHENSRPYGRNRTEDAIRRRAKAGGHKVGRPNDRYKQHPGALR